MNAWSSLSNELLVLRSDISQGYYLLVSRAGGFRKIRFKRNQCNYKNNATINNANNATYNATTKITYGF